MLCLSVYEEVMATAGVDAGKAQGKRQEQQIPGSTLGFHHPWPNLKVTSCFTSLDIFFMQFQTLSIVRGWCARASVIPENAAVPQIGNGCKAREKQRLKKEWDRGRGRGKEEERGRACSWESAQPQITLQTAEMLLRGLTPHQNAQGIKHSRLERTFLTDHILKLLYLTDKNNYIPGKLTYQEYPVKWLVAKQRLNASLLRQDGSFYKI